MLVIIAALRMAANSQQWLSHFKYYSFQLKQSVLLVLKHQFNIVFCKLLF